MTIKKSATEIFRMVLTVHYSSVRKIKEKIISFLKSIVIFSMWIFSASIFAASNPFVSAESNYFFWTSIYGASGSYLDPNQLCNDFAATLQKDHDPSILTLASVGFEIYPDKLNKYCIIRMTTAQEVSDIRPPFLSVCPANSTGYDATGCICNTGYKFNNNYYFSNPTPDACIVDNNPPPPPPPEETDPSTAEPTSGGGVIAGMCTANPILPATGEKYRHETDWSDSGPAALSFERTYRSGWATQAQPQAGMGSNWTHNHALRLALTAATATTPGKAALISPEGSIRRFTQARPGAPWVASDSADTLSAGSNGGWTHRGADTDITTLFSAAGQLQSQTQRNGWRTSYAYDANGRLSTITSPFGRVLTLGYNSTGQLNAVTAPDNRSLGYAYDAQGRLSSVTYPDGKRRSFLYEDSAHPQALTAILNEAGIRWGNFAYDSQGRAISSQLAGGAERYQVSYTNGTGGTANTIASATIIDPLNTSRNYSYATVSGKLAVTGGDQPAASGGGDAKSRVQDPATGLITSETDYNNVRTDTTWNSARRLPLAITRAAGTPEQQSTSIEWHPQYALPVRVTETGRTTTFEYDTSGRLLKRTVADTAAQPATSRTWQWKYNAQGLVATSTQPNGAEFDYEYDNRGNVVKVTNELWHVTQYSYDNANRLTRRTDPNGLVTTYDYDARDRLLTQVIGAGLANAQTTRLAYTATGQLASLTQPSGLATSYNYDDAQRLVGWSNNRGESGNYALDGLGNRINETIRNSAGAIAWQSATTINTLNRVATYTVGTSQSESYGYDANGEHTRTTNAQNQSTSYGLDTLRRIQTITNAANAQARLSYNALDAIVQAKDYKGVTTTYERNADGQSVSEASPDSGEYITTHYQGLGLPDYHIDGGTGTTHYQHDPLGRLTLIAYEGDRFTDIEWDSAQAGTGQLAAFNDIAGTTTYVRDPFGRVTRKTQKLANGNEQSVSYSYGANGQIAAITYPGGATLSHQYDTIGRLVQLSWNGAPLITNLQWNALGQPTAWTWAFTSSTPKLAASRSYDNAGRLTQSEHASYQYDSAGRITNLTQQIYAPGDSDPSHSTLTSLSRTWSVSYDSVGRITRLADTAAGGASASYQYDANGNRTQSIQSRAGTSTTRNYQVGANSNRLLGFTQQIGTGAQTSVSYSYNPNANLLGDGLRSYGYDKQDRLVSVTTGSGSSAPTIKYAHNALGQRVFKTEALYAPEDESLLQGIGNFFTRLWSGQSEAEKLGWAYLYDEQGALLAEQGMGGATSVGQSSFVYLPTASGPMPIAANIDGNWYAIHADHLNTPRRLTNAQGQAVWQWSYSAFGEDNPTQAKNRFADTSQTANPGTTSVPEVRFNLRYPGQYADQESGLFYNYFRSYDPKTGRYSQPDPMGLAAGFNRFPYADGNPLMFIDPDGLMQITASKLPSGDYAGQYRFTFSFDCGASCVELRRIFDFAPIGKTLGWIRRMANAQKKYEPLSAGLDDVENYRERLACSRYEGDLKDQFTSKGYRAGRFSGTGLTEDQARDFMREAGQSLPPEIRKMYDWNNLIDKSKQRAPSLPFGQ